MESDSRDTDADTEEITTYVINKQVYDRIPFGEEPGDWGADQGPCHCGAIKGQCHDGYVGCCVEHCPRCGGQALTCDCDYEGDDEAFWSDEPLKETS